MIYFLRASALFYGLTGAVLLFLPEEVLAYLHLNIGPGGALVFQLMGTLYLGFGFLNYSNSKGPLNIGYLRPVLATNLGHSLMAGLTLITALGDLSTPFAYVISLLCLSYLTIGLISGGLIMRPPVNTKHV